MAEVSWYATRTAEVDEALSALPECECCPHSLYRELLSLPAAALTSIAVVRDAGQPIAVVGMTHRRWLAADPSTNWLFPGGAFPAVTSRRLDALSALGREIRLSWWHMGEPVPDHPSISDMEISPTHRMEDISIREEYWRSTDLRRNVKNIRNRTKNMRIEVGNLAHVEPIVAGWHARWTGRGASDIAVRGRVAIARALEGEGRHITVALLDGDEIVAGATNFVHRGEMVAGVSHTSEKNRQLGVGVRLIDAVFDVAEARGLKTFDLGGGADYKIKWAPIGGERATFTVAGSGASLVRRFKRMAKAVMKRAA